MKTRAEVIDLLASDRRTIEREVGLLVRNGQASTAVKKTLAWVLK